MINLNPEERQQLISILRSIREMNNERDREDILLSAGLKEFIHRIDLTGATNTVVGNIVNVLADYGYNDKFQSVLRLFLTTIIELQYTGYQNQIFLYQIIDRIYQLEKAYSEEFYQSDSKNKLKRLQEKLKNQEKSNQSLIEEAKSLQAANQEIDRLKEELKQRDESLQNLIQSRDNYSTQSEELKEKISNYETRINQLEEQGKQVATRAEEYQSQLKQTEGQLEVEKSTCQQKLQQLEERSQQQIQAKEAEINNLEAKLEKERSLKQKLEAKNKQLELTERSLKEEQSIYQQDLQKLQERSQEQLQVKETEINSLRAELERLQEQERSLQLELEKNKQKQQEEKEIPLKSDRNIDYTKLRDLLAAQKWRDADSETAKVMLQAADRTSEEYLTEKDIESFPCEDLRTINQLWLKHSNGYFGFSVQKKIWLSVGGQPGKFNWTVFSKFGARVGWRVNNDWHQKYDDFTFTLDAPEGHLPSLRFPGVENGLNCWKIWKESFQNFLPLVETCLLI